MWYFAYGSNLNQADLDRWCDNRPVPRLNLNQKTWQRATLEGCKLVFDCVGPTQTHTSSATQNQAPPGSFSMNR